MCGSPTTQHIWCVVVY